eukprot:scaffold55504_cov63-Phaeocystis_antarctica.AAC.1
MAMSILSALWAATPRFAAPALADGRRSWKVAAMLCTAAAAWSQHRLRRRGRRQLQSSPHAW